MHASDKEHHDQLVTNLFPDATSQISRTDEILGSGNQSLHEQLNAGQRPVNSQTRYFQIKNCKAESWLVRKDQRAIVLFENGIETVQNHTMNGDALVVAYLAILGMPLICLGATSPEMQFLLPEKTDIDSMCHFICRSFSLANEDVNVPVSAL